MRASKKSMRGFVAVRHSAHPASVCCSAQFSESNPANFPSGNSPGRGSWLDRARADFLPAEDLNFIRVSLPGGLGGVEPMFDQVESLADYANTEFRLAIAEGVA